MGYYVGVSSSFAVGELPPVIDTHRSVLLVTKTPWHLTFHHQSGPGTAHQDSLLCSVLPYPVFSRRPVTQWTPSFSTASDRLMGQARLHLIRGTSAGTAVGGSHRLFNRSEGKRVKIHTTRVHGRRTWVGENMAKRHSMICM